MDWTDAKSSLYPSSQIAGEGRGLKNLHFALEKLQYSTFDSSLDLVCATSKLEQKPLCQSFSPAGSSSIAVNTMSLDSFPTVVPEA